MKARSGEALLAFDTGLRVLDWNSAAEELTGIPASEVVGRFCWEVLCARDGRGNLVCHAGCSNARLASEGWPVPTRRLSIKTAAGNRDVEVATVRVDADGEPIFLHLLRDGDEVVGEAGPSPTRAPKLSARQEQILDLLAEGVPAKVIAARLGLADTTVRNHIRALFRRLGCHSQLEAIATARRLKILG